MQTSVKTPYDIQYLTIQLNRYMNAPTEPAFNIACTIRMKPKFTHERKFLKLKKSPINATSNQYIQKSAKLRNTLTSFTRIVMHTMQVIYHTDAHSHPQFISSMVPLLPGSPINSLKPPEAVQMQKQ